MECFVVVSSRSAIVDYWQYDLFTLISIIYFTSSSQFDAWKHATESGCVGMFLLIKVIRMNINH